MPQYRSRMPLPPKKSRQQQREDLHAYIKREVDHDELQELSFPNPTDPSKQGINPRRVDYTITIDPPTIIGFGTIGGMRT
jgi:hypothetical protein